VDLSTLPAFSGCKIMPEQFNVGIIETGKQVKRQENPDEQKLRAEFDRVSICYSFNARILKGVDL